MTNKTYDKLKYVAQIALPACATLYGALACIWGLPYGKAIVATISAVDLFMGELLKISTTRYEVSAVASMRSEIEEDRSDEGVE